MRTLAIDTAQSACSIALFEGDRLLAHDHRVLGRGHAEELVPMIARLPEKGRADRILVSLGPGSFTGVRIGLATARALGVAWQVPVLGYPTLALIAAMAQARHEARPVTVCTNGGHGEWFVQWFDAQGLPQADALSLTPAGAVHHGHETLVAGNRAQELLEEGLEEAPAAASNQTIAMDLLPDAASALLVPESLLAPAASPIYGRAPDAKVQIPANTARTAP